MKTHAYHMMAFLLTAAILLSACVLTGCGAQKQETPSSENGRPLTWDDYGTEGLRSVSLRFSEKSMAKKQTVENAEKAEELVHCLKNLALTDTSLSADGIRPEAEAELKWEDGKRVQVSLIKVMMTSYAMGTDGVCRESSEETGVIFVETAEKELLMKGQMSQTDLTKLTSLLTDLYQAGR